MGDFNRSRTETLPDERMLLGIKEGLNIYGLHLFGFQVAFVELIGEVSCDGFETFDANLILKNRKVPIDL
jgi:hypothetical protein